MTDNKKRVEIGFRGIKATHYSVEYWNIYVTDEEIVFYFQGESFRNMFLRWQIESEEIEDVISPDVILKKHAKNFSLKRSETESVFIKWGNFIVREKLSIKTRDNTCHEFILAPSNRVSIFNEIIYTEFYKKKINFLNLTA